MLRLLCCLWRCTGTLRLIAAHLPRALRTPLTTIYGSSAALRDNTEVLTPEQRTKILPGIQQNTDSWYICNARCNVNGIFPFIRY